MNKIIILKIIKFITNIRIYNTKKISRDTIIDTNV